MSIKSGKVQAGQPTFTLHCEIIVVFYAHMNMDRRMLGIGLIIVGVVFVLGWYWLNYQVSPSEILIPSNEQIRESIPTDIAVKANKRDPSARLVMVLVGSSSDWIVYTFAGNKPFDIFVVGDGQSPVVTTRQDENSDSFTTFRTLERWTLSNDKARKQAQMLISSFEGVKDMDTLQHVPITALHGGADPPPSLSNPINPYWVITATKIDGTPDGFAVYVDAITGQLLFSTETALE
ncbi:hypothetical protein IH781_03705 [Patescibacteria group bacterium]|nr:hypothetical protein [Patescibacteria group bacterium]